ncbi:MAG: ankyrin repeat domain-containing protein [Fimbriiglobus sp.]
MLTDAKRRVRIAKLKHIEDKVSDFFSAEVGALGITGGEIRLAAGGDDLTVTSMFKAPTPLTSEQLGALVGETTGQWSDGIGEGCFDEAAERLGVTIDLCPDPSQVTVAVVDDGKTARAKSPKRMANEKLVAAARNGDLEGVKAALAAGTDLEAVDPKNKWTALFWSTCGATDGHTAVALFLTAAGADVNAKCSSSSPLMSEVRNVTKTSGSRRESLEVVKALLAAGADPNQTYVRDRVLTMAKNHVALRELLLAAGAIESNWVLREQGKYP